MKGIGAVFFILLIGIIAIISVWLFFTFFKVHITGIAIDVDSINRYQEVPTVILSSSVFENSESSCFKGDGPAGAHELNENLCTKGLAFYYNLYKTKQGDDLFAQETENMQRYLNNIRISLPVNCYEIGFQEGDARKVLLDGTVVATRMGSAKVPTISCNTKQPKISEVYPVPTFVEGYPVIAIQSLVIGSSTSTGEKLLSTWPYFNVKYTFGG